MTLYKIARFYPDNQSDTNQEPIDPSSRPASHGGAAYQIKLGQAEIDLIKRVNPGNAEHTAEQVWKWACHEEAGFLYVGDWHTAPWKWPMVIMGSGEVKVNIVNVIGSERGKRKIETIPALANYDHLSPQTHPHLFHRVVVTNRTGDWDSPVGIFWMPLFSAIGRPHPRGELTGAWIRSAYVGDVFTGQPPEPPVEPPPATNVVIVLRRTVLRQGPSEASRKMDVAFTGDKFTIIEVRNGWGLTVKGWIDLDDTKPEESKKTESITKSIEDNAEVWKALSEKDNQ